VEFCTKCGEKTNGTSLCASCEISTTTNTDEQGNMTAKDTATKLLSPNAGVFSIGDFVKFNAINEDEATLTVAGFTVTAKALFFGISIALYVLFFFSFFRLTINMGTFGSVTQTYSGWNLAFGASTSAFAIFLFVNCIVIDLVLFLKTSLSALNGKLFLALGVVFGAGLLFMILLNNDVTFTRRQFGYNFSFILWLLGVALAVLFYIAGKKK